MYKILTDLVIAFPQDEKIKACMVSQVMVFNSTRPELDLNLLPEEITNHRNSTLPGIHWTGYPLYIPNIYCKISSLIKEAAKGLQVIAA
jgi:hypothetical protein